MADQRMKIAVLMGGPSSEHEVSLKTGENVIEALDKKKYDVVKVRIDKNGQWMSGRKRLEPKTVLNEIELVFNALHGEFGEDGKIQAILEFYKKPYTGSGILASALAMNKIKSRELFKFAGLNVPKSILIKKNEVYNTVLNFFTTKISNFPVVIKPNSRGSSVGISIVYDSSHLDEAINEAFKYDSEVIVEEFIKGDEITSSLLENYKREKYFVLPATQVIPAEMYGFFSYDAKYLPGATREITPAALNEELEEKVKEVTLKAHKALNCSGYSRTDMIIRENKIYVLELNSLPGMTETSLLPQQANAVGLTFTRLLDIIIKSSLD